MHSSTIRKLTIENKSFSLNALIANPDAYLPLMQPLVRANAFERKASETSDQYFTRLFNLLYSKQSRRSNIGNTATHAQLYIRITDGEHYESKRFNKESFTI